MTGSVRLHDDVRACQVLSLMDPAKGTRTLSVRPPGAYVEHTAPRVLIGEGFLHQVSGMAPAEGGYLGHVLRIEAVDRTVIYRITGYQGDGIYIGEWPD